MSVRATADRVVGDEIGGVDDAQRQNLGGTQIAHDVVLRAYAVPPFTAADIANGIATSDFACDTVVTIRW